MGSKDGERGRGRRDGERGIEWRTGRGRRDEEWSSRDGKEVGVVEMEKGAGVAEMERW